MGLSKVSNRNINEKRDGFRNVRNVAKLKSKSENCSLVLGPTISTQDALGTKSHKKKKSNPESPKILPIVWWDTLIIAVLRMWWQKRFKVIIAYPVRLGPAWAI